MIGIFISNAMKKSTISRPLSWSMSPSLSLRVHVLRLSFIIALLLLSSTTSSSTISRTESLVLSWDIMLKLEQEASHGVGGEAFETQPVISVYNKKGITKYNDIQGRIVASCDHEGKKMLGVIRNTDGNSDGNSDGSGECIVPSSNDDEISVNVVMGVANFSQTDLCINRSTSTSSSLSSSTSTHYYSIKFVLFDEFNITLGEVTQTNIEVMVGDAYQIGVIRAPNVVTGGRQWMEDVNPIVAIQDRGGNTVVVHQQKNMNNITNHGTVSIALANNIHGETLTFEVEYEVEFEEIYQVHSPSTVPWENGIAQFYGISIQTVDTTHGYQLNFTTDIDLPGGSGGSSGSGSGSRSFLSDPIYVQSGPPHEISIMEEPGDGIHSVYGGKGFIHQPLLHILDAGGNVAIQDSTSRVVVDLYSNPTTSTAGGNLLPLEKRVATVEKGIVQFRNLYIDKAGEGYRLQYTLWSMDEDGNVLNESNITGLGSVFNVNVGAAQGLKLLRKPSNTWAGNQPFQIQPKVAIVDAGGNTIRNISNLAIDTTVVQSLSQISHVSIDTRNDPIPTIEKVYFLPSILEDHRTRYSSGHNISIGVLFTQEVYVTTTTTTMTTTANISMDALVKPTLILNVTDVVGNYASAVLHDDHTFDSPSRELTFMYHVDVSEEQTALDILDGSSIHVNECLITDAWGRNASLVLPNITSAKTLLNSKEITVHGLHPRIVQIKSLVHNGIYRAGDQLDFEVTFSNEVSIRGKPRLPLDVKSYIAIVNGTQVGTSLSKSYFYIRYKGERSRSIHWNAPADFVADVLEGMKSIKGNVCVSRSRILPDASKGFSWAIRFDTVLDDMRLGFEAEPATVRRKHNATNITTSFVLQNETLSNWITDDGDESMCTYRHAEYYNGTGTNNIHFRYTVLPGDETSELKLTKPPTIHINDTVDSISNALNNGIESDIYANATWLNENETFDWIISIDTNPAQISDVDFFATSNLNETLRAGDILYINVAFDRPISHFNDLALDLKDVRNNGALATFDSKPSSSSILLSYLVEPNQWTPDLSLGNYPDTLFINSDIEPPLINLTLPYHRVNPPMISIDGRTPKIENIDIPFNGPNIILKEGDQIPIRVNFTSPVVIVDGPPVLVVSAGKYFSEIPFIAGNETSSLTFEYTVGVGDTAPPMVSFRMFCVASGCLEGVSREGYILQASSNPSLFANIIYETPDLRDRVPVFNLGEYLRINTTDSPPTNITSTSLISHGNVTVSVGEMVRFEVNFSDNIYCEGAKPELHLDIVSNAIYESGCGTKTIVFSLLTTLSDETSRIQWNLVSASRSAIICDEAAQNPCKIVNSGGALVNTAFADEMGNNLVAPFGNNVTISTAVPSIISVYTKADTLYHCVEGKCVYTAGDRFVFFVKFDLPVFVDGFPSVPLSAVDEKGEGTSASYDPIMSNDTDIAFGYLVGLDHSSHNLPLTYTPSKIQASYGLSSIRRKSTYPVVPANLSLPGPEGLYPDRQIFVDAISIPIVNRTFFLNETDSYSPGDRIVFSVEFNEKISISGTPVMLLDVGNGVKGCATYFGGNFTNKLMFEYTIQSSHCTTKLDYIDRHSLEINPSPHCENEASTMKKASESPTLNVNRCLPDPGTIGSLSWNSTIELDCRKPYISKVWSPQEAGEYQTGDMISIMIEFSRAVQVEGIPFLLLETGLVDRKAVFVSQVNETTLHFEYEVQLGDFTKELEYWSYDDVDRTSSPSFSLDGASIMIPATRPIINADIHLNPSHGHLDGQNIKEIVEGESEYLGLKIGKRGIDYKLRFGVDYNGNRFETEASVSVGQSCEYQVTGNDYDRNPGDQFGSSLSLSGDLLAVGAPQKKVPSSEVQVLNIRSNATSVEREVQLVSTQLNAEDGTVQIQKFTTFANKNATIGGSFSLSYTDRNTDYEYSSSIDFRSNVDANYMKSMLMETFPILGNIHVEREKNLYCGCQNGWTWSITFFDASHGISLIQTDGNMLTGDGSQLSNATLAQSTSMLGGYFTLYNPFSNATTRLIPFNSSALDMKTCIEEDLEINVHDVLVANLDKRDRADLGRRWTIIFSSYSGLYGEDINVPNLIPDGSSLTGSSASVWCHVGNEGKAPVTGSFAVSLRGSNFSDYIPYDASEEELKVALESLDSINSVTISDRRKQDLGSGFSWTITFNSVNFLSDYGWIYDPGATNTYGNLHSLDIDSHLIGWETKIIVENEFGAGSMDTQAQWMAKTRGDDGTNQGEVAIHRRSIADEWKIEELLSASDGDARDNFGQSVHLWDGWVAIGAPSKEVNGLTEEQIMICRGNVIGGSFTVKFRGQQSDPISFDASLHDIHKGMQGLYGGTSRLHSLPEIFVHSEGDWVESGEGFCSDHGNNVTITFLTPDGGGRSTDTHTSGNIEDLILDQSNLLGGTIDVVQSREGTRSLSGETENLLGHQAGAVYMFKHQKLCQFCKNRWRQTQKLTSMDGLESPVDMAQFGSSVALFDDVLLVGSPGYMHEAGKVYSFSITGNKWEYKKSLSCTLWKVATAGDRFGHDIVAHKGTVLISAPGHDHDKGAVFVFRNQEHASIGLLASQMLQEPPGLNQGARFGHAIAVYEDQALICAPLQYDNIVRVTGSCFVYTRNGVDNPFVYKQKLTPSNIQPRDRFGWSAAMTVGKIIVGQLQDYSGRLSPNYPIQTIRTRCGMSDCHDKIGSTFQLGWRNDSIRTRPIAHDVTAKELKRILEEDLETGIVHVTRSDLPDINGGYTWAVTFNAYDYRPSTPNIIPKINCDSRELTGSMPICLVEIEKNIPKPVRGKVHLFTDRNEIWREQAFLFPMFPQEQDLFGNAVAIDINSAAVGSPNRNLLNVNSGAVMVYDLSFANFYFNTTSYSIKEGQSKELFVHKVKSTTHKESIIGFKSMDINADDELQHYVTDLWDLNIPSLQARRMTAVQEINGHTAYARNQYYGGIDNRSEWLSGMFDYRGVNDYQPVDEFHLTKSDSNSESFILKTTNDGIYEAPDETLSIHISMPGMFASQLGDLKVDVTIENDDDGFVGNMTYYSKMFGDSNHLKNHFGSTVDIMDKEGLIVIGSDLYDGNSGIAYLFKRETTSNKWQRVVALLPPSPPTKNSYFGASVSMSRPYGREDVTILVGEPGQVAAHVFVFDLDHETITHQAVLSPFDETFATAEHRFADRGAVSVNGDMAFVGASKLEAVFCYRRLWDKETMMFRWQEWMKLRSNDYDYDMYDNGYTVQHVHEQLFGLAVRSSRRLLLVSSPYADYGNRGDISEREKYNTNGLFNAGLGKGKVYAFNSRPHIVNITCSSDSKPSGGSFKLFLNGSNVSSSLISHDESGQSFKGIIEGLPMIGEVEISVEQTDDDIHPFKKSWIVAFISMVTDEAPLIEAKWKDDQCDECESFQVGNHTDTNTQINVQVITSLETFVQTNTLEGSDVISADGFGISIDIDDDIAIVGAPLSSANTRTTWDFETGNLVGWFATGDAFDYQPTYGDNSGRRMIYRGFGRPESHTSGKPQSSLLDGRYYIGTYEKRPGNDTNYLSPDWRQREGDVQGDEPMGTLTSDPFMILGESISFLIGGGCDHMTEYVELLVDGFATMRATGQCSEGMTREHWNVDIHKGRSAQIRIVDASKELWGHINVDDIEFSWLGEGRNGGCSNSGGSLSSKASGTGKHHYSGGEESPKSGVAYIFRRQCKDWMSTFMGYDCTWIQEQRLAPSDKRSGNLFGASVSIDKSENKTTCLVGSASAPAYGFYKETPSAYPFDPLMKFPLSQKNEFLIRSGGTHSPIPSSLRLLDHLKQNVTEIPNILPERYSDNAGAAYFYRRNQEQDTAPDQCKNDQKRWHISEQAKIAPPDIHGNMLFGSSMAMSSTTAIIGSENGEAIFQFALDWYRIKFSKVEYVVLEGSSDEVRIDLVRDNDTIGESIFIGYSTSDLTALGVDKMKVSSCRENPIEDRDGCGDYEQTTGIAEFAVGELHTNFTIQIVDDNCWERHLKYIQLNLHVPGGSAIQGEQFRAQVRIDDNDWDSGIQCSDGIS